MRAGVTAPDKIAGLLSYPDGGVSRQDRPGASLRPTPDELQGNLGILGDPGRCRNLEKKGEKKRGESEQEAAR